MLMVWRLATSRKSSSWPQLLHRSPTLLFQTWSPALGRLFSPSTTLQPPDLIRFAIQHPNKTSQVVRMTNWYKIKLCRRIAAGQHVEYLKGTDAERWWYPLISHVKSIGKHVESLTCRVPTLRPLVVKTEPTRPFFAPKKEQERPHSCRSSPAILSWLAVIVADLGAWESANVSEVSICHKSSSSCKHWLHLYCIFMPAC